MHIECQNCKRFYEVDKQRIQGQKTALCLCGDKLFFDIKERHKQFGKYSLIRRLAIGGMGEIYYAKVLGLEGFEKEVAVKKLLPHLSADRGFVEMMVKEAKITVMMNHPNIMSVFDLAKEGDEYYIAMEYIPGITVSEILHLFHNSKRQLPVEVVVHIMLQILKGLSYAHHLILPSGEEVCILHRDITPQNIMVTKAGYVKITDFGIAKAINEISTTSPGIIKGKLGYLSPEQLEGKEPDEKVDLFCAGILFWEMLMIKRLFKGKTEADTFRLIAECQIPLVRELRQDISPELEEVYKKALDKQPENRYPKADDFYKAITQAILPQTPDDCAAATRDFFSNNLELFANLEQSQKIDIEDATQQTLADEEKIEAITYYLLKKEDFFQRSLSGFSRSIERTLSLFLLYPQKKSALFLSTLSIGIFLIGLGLYTLWPSPKTSGQVLFENALETSASSAYHEAAKASSSPTANTMAKANTSMTMKTASSDEIAPAKEQDENSKTAETKTTEKKRLHRETSVRPLSAKDVRNAVQRRTKSLAGCLKNQIDAKKDLELFVELHIKASGHIEKVGFSPALATQEQSDCLEGIFKQIKIHPLPYPATVKLPLIVQQQK